MKLNSPSLLDKMGDRQLPVVKNKGSEEPPPVITLPSNFETLQDILSCPICREFMLGQIRLCVSGHSICGDCFAKLQNCNGDLRNCPLCRKPLEKNAGRNYKLEQLASASGFRCRFYEKGCLAEIPGHYFYIHVKECKYRDFKCRLFKSLQTCPFEPSLLSEFLKHLETDHKILRINSGSWFQRRYFHRDVTFDPPVILIDFDGKTFVAEINVLDEKYHRNSTTTAGCSLPEYILGNSLVTCYAFDLPTPVLPYHGELYTRRVKEATPYYYFDLEVKNALLEERYSFHSRGTVFPIQLLSAEEDSHSSSSVLRSSYVQSLVVFKSAFLGQSSSSSKNSMSDCQEFVESCTESCSWWEKIIVQIKL